MYVVHSKTQEKANDFNQMETKVRNITFNLLWEVLLTWKKQGFFSVKIYEHLNRKESYWTNFKKKMFLRNRIEFTFVDFNDLVGCF